MATTSSSALVALLPKLQDADADFRFMSLNDLSTALSKSPTVLNQDLEAAASIVDGVVKTLDDQNGEVQNAAIKCLGPLAKALAPRNLASLIDKLAYLRTQKSVDQSVTSTALRTVVVHLPHPAPGGAPAKGVEDAYSAISRYLIPRMLGYSVTAGSKVPPKSLRGMLAISRESTVSADAVDLLVEVGECFGPMLKEEELAAFQKAINDILGDDRTSSVTKKRAVAALAVLAAHFSDGLLSSFVSLVIEGFRDPHLTPSKRRLLIMTTGAMARSNPRRFGRYLQTLTPFILSPLSQTELNEQMEKLAEEGESDPELDEVREAALVALDCFLASCGTDMRFYMRETIDAALRFLSYDPNFADNNGPSADGIDDDEGMDSSDDFGADDDVEEEGGFSDEEDMSWKVRRCAAKVLYTMISARTKGDLLETGTLYETIAPVLLQRFKEREENVRLEIIATMSLLIRKTNERLVVRKSSGAEDSRGALPVSAHGRKRRREGSESTALETHPTLQSALPLRSSGQSAPQPDPESSLATIGHLIVTGAVKLLKLVSQPTRQASILLLKEIALVRPSSLSESLAEVMNCIADILLPSASQSQGLGSLTTAAASVTGSSLRIEALSLVSVVADTHQYSTLRPLVDKLIPGVAASVRDRLFKLSSEAINVVEHFIGVLTHVEQQKGNGSDQMLVEELYEILVERINSNNVDSEVKQQALHALGVLLGATSNISSAQLLSQSKRSAALNTLYERVKNETTRLAAIRAVDDVIRHASSKDAIPQSWAHLIIPELGGQLRKVDRTLKIASVAALRDLVHYQVKYGQVDNNTAGSIMGTMTPLLSDSDLHLLDPALEILASLVVAGGDIVVSEDMTRAICTLTTVEASPAVLAALLALVASIGKRGLGRPLMTNLLNEVGVSGVPAVAGKVIATLLVSAGPEVGVRLDDFSTELKSARDDKRKCLALAVLGETGFLLGAASPLGPDIFMAHFKSKSEQVPLAAAVALGRAGAANIPNYLPVILQNLDRPGSSQYLLLHSIKEVLHSSGNVEAELAPFFRHIWDKVLSTASLEDNKTIAAECIGRIVVLDPKSYLPQLQNYLRRKEALVRGTMIQAFRYALTDSDDAHDYIFQPAIVGLLTSMLNDADLENARLGLTTLNAAAHNKPHLISPQLNQLLPLVMRATEIKPELIREVQMGPFKHKVDDGIELRKSAFETLYAIMETAFQHMDVVELFDRVLAGLRDDHDIRVLCNLMLSKLITLEPDETTRRLDEIAERFRETLSVTHKENAVKQEIEKAEEASRAVLKVALQLNRTLGRAKAASSGDAGGAVQHATWQSFWQWVLKTFDKALDVIAVEETSKSGSEK